MRSPLRTIAALVLLLFTSCVSIAEDQEFFPKNSFERDGKVDGAIARWYTTQLNALEEPSLWQLSKKSQDVTVYRFLWLRTFDHPISIRLDIHPDGSGTLTTKICDGGGGYEPGKIIINHNVSLSPQITAAFISDVQKQNYWNLPTEEFRRGFDGARWILEGDNKNNYKIVDRWSPEDGPIRELGLRMIDLAGLQLKKDEIY